MDLQLGFLFQFLVLILLFLSNGRVESISQKNMEYGRQLSSLNEISVKTIKDKHGDIFHCVIMYKQPAFDHPRLKNHTIQMSSMIPKKMPNEATRSNRLINISLDTRCPNGTVLVRQHQQGYIQSYATFDSVWNSQYRPRPESHFAGVAFKTGMTWKYYGAQTIMDVFNISNISPTQRSAVGIIIIKGLDGPIEYVNYISAGWEVAPGHYGDKISRLFTFWTADGNQKTGCYNIYCSGFIQLSKSVTLGMRLPTGKGVLKLTIYKDVKTLNWYLLMGEQEIIGYWPKELFNNLVDASEIQVLGYVYSPLNEPSPPMGNGLFPKPDPSKACKVSHIQLVKEKGDFLVPGSDIISYYGHEPGYYDVVNVPGVNNFSISVGGPGGYKH